MTSDKEESSDGAVSSTVSGATLSTSTAISNGSRNSLSPKRRSQRQIDRQEMETLKKIRAENEELLKKEKEKMSQALQSHVPKKDTVEIEPPSPVLSADSNVPAEPANAQPVSRLSEIRKELQQKILAVDPIKPKAAITSQKPSGKLLTVQTPKIQSGKPASNAVESSQSPISKEITPAIKDTPINAVNLPQNPISKTPSDQAPVSTPPSRPRRENRQPPKHLREAFNQLEFEGVERSVKRISRNPASLSAAENSSQESEGESTAKEKLNGFTNIFTV